MPAVSWRHKSERNVETMIIADKIAALRKRSGWSQEELAERLDVSRQSVSKWEMSQSMPDMNKIVQMSELFSVSTDFLLKDAEEMPEMTAVPEADSTAAVRVEMEDASSYLEVREEASGRIALGVLMCIIGVVPMLFLEALREAGRIALAERQTEAIGLVALFLLVGSAVALFILSGMRLSKYSMYEEETLDTAYGIDPMVKERRERYRDTYTIKLTCGIVLCVISVIPLFLALMISGSDLSEMLGTCALLTLVSFGVYLIVSCSIVWDGFKVLLQEGDYAPVVKENKKKNGTVETVYWCVVTAIYLGYSFITNQWHRSWIVWPVAGVLFGAVEAMTTALRGKN